jgi:hypothetical protein
MFTNYQTLAFFVSLIMICEQWSPPSGTFCSALCKPNNCTDATVNGCKSCDNNFMLSGTTCIVNPASGWSLIDTTDDLGGTLVINHSSTGSCGSYSFYGNLT